MATNDPTKQIKEQLIEENLKRAFTEKASEDVPDQLMALLAQLKSQDEGAKRD